MKVFDSNISMDSNYNRITSVDKHWLFMHFFGKFSISNTPDNWELVEAMCKAHNEPFERVS